MPAAGQAGAAMKPSLEAVMTTNEDGSSSVQDYSTSTTAAQAAHLPAVENGVSVPELAGTGDAAMAAVDERLDPAGPLENSLPHTNGYIEQATTNGEHRADSVDYSKVANLTGSTTDANEGGERVPPMSFDIDQPAREEAAPETQGEAILPAPGTLETQQPVEEIDTMEDIRPAEGPQEEVTVAETATAAAPATAVESEVAMEEAAQQPEQSGLSSQTEQQPTEAPQPEEQPAEVLQPEEPMEQVSEQPPSAPVSEQPPSESAPVPEQSASAEANEQPATDTFNPSMDSLPDAPAPLPSQLVNHTVPSTDLDQAGPAPAAPSEVIAPAVQETSAVESLAPEADPSSVVPPAAASSTMPEPSTTTKRPYEEDTSVAEVPATDLATSGQDSVATPTAATAAAVAADEPHVKRQKMSPEEGATQQPAPTTEPSTADTAAEVPPTATEVPAVATASETQSIDVKMESTEASDAVPAAAPSPAPAQAPVAASTSGVAPESISNAVTESDAVDAEAEEDVDAAASPEPPTLKEEAGNESSMLVDNSMIDQSLDAPGAEDSTVVSQASSVDEEGQSRQGVLKFLSLTHSPHPPACTDGRASVANSVYFYLHHCTTLDRLYRCYTHCSTSSEARSARRPCCHTHASSTSVHTKGAIQIRSRHPAHPQEEVRGCALPTAS